MRRVTDTAELAEFLNRDWPWAGFALGDLEPAMMGRCEWWREGDTVVLLFDGLTPRLLCPYGEARGLGAMLAEIAEPRVWGNIRPEFEGEFRRHYRPEKCVAMRRMYLDRPVASLGTAEALSAADQGEIEELLRQGEWVLFLPQCLESGHFYGVRREGRLVAMAGVHVASARYGIAALGSVFTHPEYRGMGLAKVCASHVLASVGRAGIGRVVLNVEDGKAGARGLYERLGFATACVYLEGECVRVAAG